MQYTDVICAKCLQSLPRTHFENIPGNPVEKMFEGRINLQAVHSEFFYSKGKKISELIQSLKYKDNKEAGEFLGKLLGLTLKESSRFNNIDAIIPIPLNSKREHKRGYNQAAIIADAISAETNIPVIKKAMVRERFTETQTKKHRMDRWENVQGSFKINDMAALENKHILLVDDVLTTGGTMEAAGREILSCKGTKLSIATLAFSSI